MTGWRRTWPLSVLIVMGALACAHVHSARADVVYADNFSTNGSLNGAAPTTASGTKGGSVATWSASTSWTKAGGVATISSGGTSNNAFLPFTPQSGLIYSLSLDGTINAPKNGDILALGFTGSNATTTNFSTTVNAAPWIDQARNGGTQNIHAYLGPNTTGPGDPVTTASTAGQHNIKVTLNTIRTQWMVQWFVDGALIRTATYAVNPTITAVGFGRVSGAGASVDNFSLTAVTPEPATWAMMGLGLLLIMAWTRRQKRQETSQEQKVQHTTSADQSVTQ